MQRTILAAALLAVLPGLAHATDIAGDGSTNASLPVSGSWTAGAFETAGDKDWYRVNLKAGKWYNFGFDTVLPAVFTLRGPTGKVIRQQQSGIDEQAGFEYRPSVSGTFFLAAYSPEPGDYQLRATTDCPASRATTCRADPGTNRQWLLTWGYDHDWLKTKLQRGRTYRFSLSMNSGNAYLALRDSGGKVLIDNAGWNMTWRAGYSGDYYVTVLGSAENGAPYTLTVR